MKTLQIISHLVCHKPTKWISDNQQCYNIYIYIYIYIYIWYVKIFCRLVGWLVSFMAYQPFKVILGRIHFNGNFQFYFKLFSLAWVHSLIVKTSLFQAIQFSQTVLIQPIQFSLSIDFVYTVKYQNSSILNNSV